MTRTQASDRLGSCAALIIGASDSKGVLRMDRGSSIIARESEPSPAAPGLAYNGPMKRTSEVLANGTGRPWIDGDMLDMSQPLVFTVEGVMSPEECAQTVARIEALGPSAAPITTSRGFVHAPKIRNNSRVMFDDAALAAELFARVRPLLPDPVCRQRPVGVNERFRGYRYGPGERFAPHFDGAFRRSPTEESQLTFMVYLDEGCIGGDTEFLDLGIRVTPRPGLALLFQHRLLHEGSEVHVGVKHVLRSDIMYSAA